MIERDWHLNTHRVGPMWLWFDLELYASNDSDAALAVKQGADAAIADYMQRGERRGYKPNLFFCPAYYARTYPDVARLVAEGGCTSLFDHFAESGWRDRNPHWLFSTSFYASTYVDLTLDVVAPLGGHYGHYLNSGAEEGRKCHTFFDPIYATAYMDGAAMLSEEAANPFARFLAATVESVSRKLPEPRAVPYFDPSWYLASYTDVAEQIFDGRVGSALEHYLNSGIYEGKDPLCDFSESYYLNDNPDVAEGVSAGYFRNGYEHFLQYGVVGLRSPCDHIDLAFYAGQPQVAQALANGIYPDAFTHLLLVGIPEGYSLLPPTPRSFVLDETEARSAFMMQAERALLGYGRQPIDFTCNQTPAISVIMVLYNQFALTMQALASLRTTFRGPIQLILVDNASRDQTTSISDLVQGALILRPGSNIGFLRACNLALVQATADAVLYLNNDVVLHPNAVTAALRRLFGDATTGAVGGKIIRTHGLLQEAGCVVWRDASAEGWMRDALPDAPEANYVREVDYCSGAFLLVRRQLLFDLGGFDERLSPAYYEETDLCFRIREMQYRVIYDPAVELTHYEYGSSRSLRAATALMLANKSKFSKRHADALRRRSSDRTCKADAANFATKQRRVLFVEDTVPLPQLGSGYGRAFQVIEALVEAGWQVSVFPMHGRRTEICQITASYPDRVEVLWDHNHTMLTSFLASRNAYYDVIWISRAHNLQAFLRQTDNSWRHVDEAAIILDTEAVFSARDQAYARLHGLPFDMPKALEREFINGWLCDHIIAVNEQEAGLLRSASLSSVSVIGFNQACHAGQADWASRRGLLHVGALTVETAPNVDALRWFLDEIHPRIVSLVGMENARLTVAGYVSDQLDVRWLRDHPAVDFLGPVGDLAPLYDSCRVFVAPTRFAAGAPTKVLEAASHGLPIVATHLLAQQLQWVDDRELLAAAIDDQEGFAERVARLITDGQCWANIRAQALAAIQTNFSAQTFSDQIQQALAAAFKRTISLPELPRPISTTRAA